MNVRIEPSLLKGEIMAPPSKSSAHRAVIAAALSSGKSKLSNIAHSQDITASLSAIQAIGADVRKSENSVYIEGNAGVCKASAVTISCRESGSTLRFFLPIIAALGVKAVFIGCGRLPARPIEPLSTELKSHGIILNTIAKKDMVAIKGNVEIFDIKGKLTGKFFSIAGDISSQFVTGLLFALPLLEEDSVIHITTPLESAAYVNMTVQTLKKFGIEVSRNTYGDFEIQGAKKYIATDMIIEGDYSNAAFWMTANKLGSDIICGGLDEDSLQGDKAIIDILNNDVREIDAKEIPDLVPILTVLGACTPGEMRIVNASRLRIKECDRLAAITDCLNKLGGKIKEYPDSLIIEGATLKGGEVDSYNDHRIVMAIAIAASVCKENVTIYNAHAVEKSYPNFFDEYKRLGGKINVF